MKNWFIVLMCFVCLLFMINLPLFVRGQQTACQDSRQLLQTLRNYHVDPPVDAKIYSDRVLNQFLLLIDPQGLYLTAADISELKPAFEQVEENLNKGDCKALQEAIRLYSRQYQFVDSLRHQFLQKPFTFNDTDTLLLTLRPRLNWAADRQELGSRWKKQLAYSLLYEAYAEAGEEPISLKNEALLRKKVQERLQCRRSRMLAAPNGLEVYVGEQFLQALATAFDPHTNYLPPADKEQYLAALSTETASFGIELEENQQGDIQIARLVPGGPAWKSNELHEGDVLLSLRTSKGLVKEFACTSLEEADKLLSDAQFSHAFLIVRKKTGQNSTVELKMEKLQVEENVVSSFMMQGGSNIGYIALPAFYTELDRSKSQGAAHDVAKEILQLKRAGMQGLILDLRNNGGGSVWEAMNLAGIFIDEGPLGVEVSRGEKPRLMKDLNRGVLYDGPLIVLVNGFSASASEILAQTLQDYNRALILGSPTYGKATMQIVLPLSGQTTDKDPPKPNEPFVKLTIGKYYGVKGSSYQKKGVNPHIALADGISTLGISELATPTALEADVVDKKILYKPLGPLPADLLAASSQERLEADKAYVRQLECVNRLTKAAGIGFPVRLSPAHFKEDYTSLLQLYEEGTSTHVAGQSAFVLSNLAAKEELLQLNQTDKEANERLMEELGEDLWLSESYQVILDLLEYQQTKNKTSKLKRP